MNKKILETYTMTPEEEIKYLRQCLRELQEKIDSMTESYETDVEAKFYEYVDKHESKLQQRIDKAIEYIETNNCGDLKITFGKDLLEILKGEPNNE